MARHYRTGEALATYLRRKRRPHKVSGLFVVAGAVGAKPIRMTRNQRLRKLHLRGGGKGGTITHYAPYICEGR